MVDLIRLTDAHGRSVVDSIDNYLTVGAVVIIEGPDGTAAQRFYSDEKFHTASGSVMSVLEMSRKPNLFHAYTPQARP